MERQPDRRRALAARLEWLRLMGVGEIRLSRAAARPASHVTSARPATPAAPAAAASPSATAPAPASGRVRPAPPPDVAPGLFAPAVAPAPGPGRSSPLLRVGVPQGPDGAARLAAIRADLGDCTRCRLAAGRTHLVFGVGDPAARLMFIGEGPGADEDRQGEPFVGRAGKLLTKIIESMGLRREQVYIANVVKCRPPENRTPLPDEVDTCAPFLFRQVKAIGPSVVVCLGTPAIQAVLGTRETISRLRGTFIDIEGIRVMPTFHPAYLLRNPAAKKDVWEDMKKVIALLKTA